MHSRLGAAALTRICMCVTERLRLHPQAGLSWRTWRAQASQRCAIFHTIPLNIPQQQALCTPCHGCCWLLKAGRESRAARNPRELLCASPHNLGAEYSLNFSQHLHSALTRICSDWTLLPEEPFVPGHSPASVKFFCLFGLMGKKFTPRSIRELPGFSVTPQRG